MPTYKPVGIDENSNFPPRVQASLSSTFAAKIEVPDLDGVGYVDLEAGIIYPDGGFPPSDIDPSLVPQAASDYTLPSSDLVDTMEGIAANVSKWMLNGEWAARFGASPPTVDDNEESTVRPITDMAIAIAVPIALGIHDEAGTGHTDAEATSRALELISALAGSHRANNENWTWGGHPDPGSLRRNYDGHQTAFWARNAGTAAWVIWGSLSEPLREQVSKMVAWEAERMIRWEVPYFLDREGTPFIDNGNTWAEEIAWNNSILSLATHMLPEHADHGQWVAKMLEMAIAATAATDDVSALEVLHGSVVGDTLDGSNINADGTVTNHGYDIHPGYMAAMFTNGCSPAISYAGARSKVVPAALVRNFDRIWDAFTELEFTEGVDGALAPGGTIYTAGGGLYYPLGTDKGSDEWSNYIICDIVAWKLGLDQGQGTTGEEWAELHADKVAALQARYSTGQTYPSGANTEHYGANRETWVASHTANALLLLASADPRVVDVSTEQVTQRLRSH